MTLSAAALLARKALLNVLWPMCLVALGGGVCGASHMGLGSHHGFGCRPFCATDRLP